MQGQPQLEPRSIGNECQWCGATVLQDHAAARRIRRRWIASIAAAVTFLVTQALQLGLGGETVVQTVAEAVE